MRTLVSCFLRFIILDNTGKNGPNILSPENSYFLKSLFLSTSDVPKKWRYLLHNNCQNTLGLLECCSPTFSCSIIGENMGHKIFFIGKWPFFTKVCVFINLLGHKKNWPYYFHSNCQNTLWTLINCSLSVLILNKTRKNEQLVFFSGKVALFFKNLCFQQPLRCLENAPMSSTVWASLASDPKKSFFTFVMSDSTGKKGAIIFVTWKHVIFEMFVSIDLQCPKEMMISFAP